MEPRRITVFDTTLRDGEQSVGIALTPQAKLEIARRLERLGVDVIEAGFPAASDGDFEAVREIAAAVRGPVIAAMARAISQRTASFRSSNRCATVPESRSRPSVSCVKSLDPIEKPSNNSANRSIEITLFGISHIT